jgi:hydroxymethylbilane synthase
MSHVATDVLDMVSFPPAPGQGAICIESRDGDARIADLVAPIADRATTVALTAERAFLAELDGSCRTPIAAHAEMHADDTMTLHGMILRPDGTEMHETRRTGVAEDAATIGRLAGRDVLAAAGPDFFAGWAR